MGIIQHQFFTVKKCSTCQQVKSTDAFYKCKPNFDGLQSHCKDCTRDIKNAYARDHREELREASREYKAKNPDVGRAWREKNKEHLRVAHQAWVKEHPVQSAMQTNRYHARKHGASGTYTITEWNDLCVEYDHRCLCCGKRVKLTADHIIPLSKGGANTIDNIQPLCKPCNSAKGTKATDYR